jgi:hypothetical protein
MWINWHVSTVVYKWWHLEDSKLLQSINQQKIHFVNKRAHFTNILAEKQQMALVVSHSVLRFFRFLSCTHRYASITLTSHVWGERFAKKFELCNLPQLDLAYISEGNWSKDFFLEKSLRIEKVMLQFLEKQKKSFQLCTLETVLIILSKSHIKDWQVFCCWLGLRWQLCHLATL